MISRGTDIAWPDHSLDFNPLDFHFWALAQRQVYASNPSTIDEVIDIVKQYAAGCSEYICFEEDGVECAEAGQALSEGKRWSFPASVKKVPDNDRVKRSLLIISTLQQ